VTLRVNAFPYQKFGDIKGVVVSVAQSPTSEINGANFSGPGSTPTGEPVYRISVRLTGQSVMAYGISQKLKTGMTLEADIRQERRRLISWLIDPVVALAKTAAP
jgi:membrane fusion protein